MTQLATWLLVTSLCAAGPASADGKPASAAAPSGVWQGGGRACSGTLSISAKRLTWRTPFSRCLDLPYASSALLSQDGDSRVLLTLARRQAGCLYDAVELVRRPVAGGEPAWEALGRLAPSAEDKAAGLACPMVRLR